MAESQPGNGEPGGGGEATKAIVFLAIKAAIFILVPALVALVVVYLKFAS